MKFSAEKVHLSRAFGILGKIVKSRTTIPILANAKMELDGNSLTITTTDMDMMASVTMTVDGVQSGKTTLPAADMANMVKAFPDGSTVKVEKDDTGFRVSAGRSRYKLPSIDASDFPVFGDTKYTVTFDIPASDISRMFSTTAPFCSQDGTKYYLMGVLLECVSDQLHAVSTNGHVLARTSISAPAMGGTMPNVIIPKETVALVMSSFTDGNVTVSVSPTRVMFESLGVRVESKVIDGNFPDYSRIIPDQGAINFESDCRDLRATTSRVGLIGTKESSGIKVTLSDGKCVLSATNSNGGEADDELPLLGSTGEIEIGFNSTYIQAVCAAMGDGPVCVSMSSPAHPALVMPSGDGGSLFVVMPMRI